MKRPRSYLLKTRIDVDVEAKVNSALREVSRAMSECEDFLSTDEGKKGLLRKRCQKTLSELREAESRLRNISAIYPLYDLTDKDLEV